MRLCVRFLCLLLLGLLCLALFPPTAADSGWSKTFGDADATEEAYGVVGTSDGGFVVAGSVNWINPHGVLVNQVDFWLMKTDAGGNLLWNRSYGNGQATNSSLFWMESASALVATSDGGFALAGSVGLWPGDIGTPNGNNFWLIKTDGNGNMLWNRSYGNPGNDYMEYARSMALTADGGYVLAGTVGPHGGASDFWVVKTDSVGNMVWNKTIGTAGNDYLPSIISTVDSGYMLLGTVNADSTGAGDAMLAKMDTSGNGVWNRTYRDPALGLPMVAYALATTLEGGYVFSGEQSETVGWAWLTGTDSQGNQLWSRNIIHTESSKQAIRAVVACANGEFVLAGSANLFMYPGRTNALLAKTDASGKSTATIYGNADSNEIANALALTSDGGYALAGNRYNSATGTRDVFLKRTNEDFMVPEPISLLALAAVLAAATPIVLAKKRLLPVKH